MSTAPDRRSRKRLATRQTISDAATALFAERGFDNVTVDEIAAAADVGRMTVFNHFSRKEEMFFDRDEESRDVLRAALRRRDDGVAPLEALRRLAHRLAAESSPLVEFTELSRGYIETIGGSETLKARARAIRDELADIVAAGLAERAGRPAGDPIARLAAQLVAAAWTAALAEGHRTYRQYADTTKATALFLTLIDRANTGIAFAMAGTPYV